MHSHAMRTHSEIIKSAPQEDEIAEKRGVSVHTVRSWVQRDKIPDEHWAGFAQEGWATLEELAAYAAAKRAA